MDELVQFVTEKLTYLVTARPTAVNMADFRDKLSIMIKRWAKEDKATVKSVTDK